MRKRGLVILGLAVCLGLGGLGVWSWLTGPAYQINRQTFLSIRLGMKKQAVLDLIGCPPGDYTTGPTVCVDSSVEYSEQMAGARIEAWLCDTDVIHVYFNDTGTVIGRDWGGVILQSQLRNPLVMVRSWLGFHLRRR